jgi:glycosyltransferase involved in cell wall biosynthesis
MTRSVCFGAEGGDSACRYFRADIPAKALRPYGWETAVAEYVLTPQTSEGLSEYGPRIRGWGGPGTDIDEPADIVTLRIMDDVVIDPATKKGADNYRMDNMVGDIRRARDDGQIVLYDIDDDLWHLPVWSPAARAMHKMVPYARACDLEVIDANIRACDGVITSTEYLARVLNERFDVPVHLLRPGIDPSVYVPKTKDHPLRVGWMGSISHHLPHLRTMQSALDCLGEYDAEFMRLGEISGDNSAPLLHELPCRVRQLPWGGISELPAKLAEVDIGIIPRVGEAFMEGQSITSGLQYAAAGVPFIASATKEYIDLSFLGVGHVADDIASWRRQLISLLGNDRLRCEDIEISRNVAFKEYGLEATGRRYDEVLRGL